MSILGLVLEVGNRVLILLQNPKDKLQVLSPWAPRSLSITSHLPKLEGIYNPRIKY